MAPSEGELLGRLKEAVLALKDVRSQRDALLREKSEPIAIIGVACRFPGGGTTPDAFFQALLDGVDAVSAVPAARWPLDSNIDSDPRLQGTRWGAFVQNVDLFDPAFFGILPREAERMDPQQRFLLECAWEAMERAGIVPGSLAGSRTGVFIGILNTDYLVMNLNQPREQQDAYSATGNGHCFPAGRIAYTFGFEGPAMSVDTACSSSLVAMHLGCHSLRTKDSNLVLVGGVNLMLDPLTTDLINKTGALAPDGRCKSFDARANGIVRGEGCGVVVLKRLSDAQRDGDQILALVRGSAVNQDGRSSGLTAPNPLAQQALLEQALANGQLQADDIGYVETHGTGTPLGDPIEMEALRAVFGKPRPNGDRCIIGAVKTNIGHTEAAAGMAGLIKACYALYREKIPKNIHYRSLNPRMSLANTPISIATDSIAWPRNNKPRRVGVSSFGMSGTNAHVILEEAPQTEHRESAKSRSAYMLPLSAKSPDALNALVKSYTDWLPNYQGHLEDVIHTSSVRRSHHEQRIAIVAPDQATFVEALASLRNGKAALGIHRGQTRPQEVPKIAFVFPGQGAQWIGMSKELLEEEAAFRTTIEACDRAIQAEAGFSILEQLRLENQKSRLSDINVLQPLLFAIEVALAALWQSWGISPDCVVGHSMGEVAAAHVAGMLSLSDAVAVICHRSRLLRKVMGQGAMAIVELTLAQAESRLVSYEGRLSIAVSNGPRSTVVAGQPAALDELIGKLEAERIFCQRMKVDTAAHSPLMDSLRGELIAKLSQLAPQKGHLAMRSTVHGDLVQGRELTADYWARNLREPVRFHHAIERLIDSGFSIFIEISPHPVLVPFIDEALTEKKTLGAALSSLRWKMDDRRSLLDSLARTYVHGGTIDWKKAPVFRGRAIDLPTYPWQRERYWIEPAAMRQEAPIPKESVDDWLFALDWQKKPLANKVGTSAPGTWLLLMETQGFGAELANALKKRGDRCIRVEAGRDYAQIASDIYRINPHRSADYVRLFNDTLAKATNCRGIIHLLGLDAPIWDETTIDSLRTTQEVGMTSALYVIQTLARLQRQENRRLWFISRGAIAVDSTNRNLSVAMAPLWGLGRTTMLEHPELGCTCVDLDRSPNDDEVAAFVEELMTTDHEEHVALRPDGRHVGRFVRTRLDQAQRVEVSIAPNANYLITGGLSGLGLSAAQWLVEQGARHLTLLGRRPPAESAQGAIENMRKVGAKILVLSCDVAQPTDMFAAFCSMSAEMPELRGIVHSAGRIEDRTLLELSPEHFKQVFAPKVAGAWNLHMLTQHQPLDFFVMYSSAASLFGSAGQGNYSAANAFLDALAHARTARGLPAMSINWGSFSEIGLAAAQENRGSRLEQRGVTPLSPSNGLYALHELLRRPRAQVAVVRMNVPRWLESFPELANRSLWLDLAPHKAAPAMEQGRVKKAPMVTERAKNILEEWASASSAERARMLEEHVRIQFGQIVRMDPAKIDSKEKFHHYGVDSLMAIELRNRLRASLNVEFSVSEIWTHESTTQLAQWLGAQLIGHSTERATALSTEYTADKPGPSTSTIGAAKQWVVIPRPLPEAKMRLICFPYAGGGAPVYSSWSDHLAPDVEVCAIQLPGRHARVNEPFLEDIDAIVNAIVPALLMYLDRPFAMFGHCLGAIIMFEVARRLISDAWLYPLQLFASGAPSPQKYLVPNIALYTDEEFVDILRAIGLAQQEVLNDADIIRTMLPMLRADFGVAAKYEYQPSGRIFAPITTFSASADSFAPSEAVEAWKQLTSSHFTSHTYPGGHYFIVPERDAILGIIRSELAYRWAALRQQSTQTEVLRPISPVDTTKTAPARIICFPGVAGTALDFQFLSRCVPASVELWAIEFPGHGARAAEEPLGRIDDMVHQVTEALRESPLSSCIFLGQDLGALVMYEVAQRIQGTGANLPKAFVVLAATAPLVHYFAPIHYLSDEEFVNALSLLGIKTNASTSLSLLRADCAALASYSPVITSALPCPIHVVVAERDKMIAPASVKRWAACTTSNFALYKTPCGHREFAGNDEAEKIIRDALAPLFKA